MLQKPQKHCDSHSIVLSLGMTIENWFITVVTFWFSRVFLSKNAKTKGNNSNSKFEKYICNHYETQDSTTLPATFEPVDLGNSIIRLLKALSSGYLNLKWKWEFLGPGRRQTNFSESGAFLVIWAWPPLGWCHTQFLYKF